MTDAKAKRTKRVPDECFKGEYKSESVYVSSDNMKISEEITPEDVQSLCRVCLAVDRKDLVPLKTAGNFSLADMFSVLTSIEIQECDVLTQVCELCKLDLEHCYQFRDKCIKSDSIIKSFLEKESSTRKSLEVDYGKEIKPAIKDDDDDEVTDVQYLEDIDLSDYEIQYLLEDTEAENENKPKSSESLNHQVEPEKEEKVVKQKKTHKRIHYCPTCNKKFKKMKTLRFHIKQKHARKDPYACGQCNNSFMSEHDLALHETVHGKGPVWKCVKCQKEFNSRTVYRRHVRRHMASQRHACERCAKSFVERHALRRHFLRVHSGQPAPRTHACHICDKRYADTGLLAAHILRHTGLRPCTCGTCGKSFPSQRLLASHALVHSDDKAHPCHFCEKRFRHESTLRTHLRTHTGEKPYVCSVCGKTFIQNSNLTLHMRTHTGERPYSCEVCSKSFSSGSTLKSHVRTHTGEKPYSCEVCGKRFARLDLRAHMRLHSGERPFQCSACPKAFPTASRMRDHVRLHTGEKPFECSMCPQKFATNSHLAKHVKSHDAKRKKKTLENARKVMILHHIQDDRPYDDKMVYAEIDPLNGDIHKDIGEQVPLEVTGELVLQENGEVKTELVMVEGQTGGDICLTDGVSFVNNDISYENNVNLVTVNDGEVVATSGERSVKLYQLDQSLVQIHSAGGQVTISQITSKMTANF